MQSTFPPASVEADHPQSMLFLRAAILFLIAAALPTYTFGPLSRAGWAVEDDHEIAAFTWPTGRLPFSAIPRVARETDIGNAGRSPRFRPLYIGTRLVETSLWGLSPAKWHRARLVLCAVFVFLAGWVVSARIGTVATVGLIVWVLSARYWWPVWGRLGVAEAWGAFGCALWVSGIHLLWPTRAESATPHSRCWLGILLFVIGNVFVVGAKENLLILAVPNVVLAFLEMRAGRTAGPRWWACVVNVVVAAAVATPLIVYFASVPIDVYGRSVAFSQRMSVLALGVAQPTALHAAFLGALTVWIGTRLLAPLPGFSVGSSWRRLTSRVLLASGSALALFLSQYVLYNGDIARDTHYEFPASLAWPALIVVVLWCVRAFFREFGALKTERVVYHATALTFLCMALINLPGLKEQRKISSGWAAATIDFTTWLAGAATAARAAPDVPIVIVSGRPIDMEAIVAVDRFLRSFGASNPRFLVLDWEQDRRDWSSLETYLAPGVERFARDGGGPDVRPARRFDPAASCFSIGLRREPRKECRSLGRLW
jgi:hypothetical protein